MRLLEYRGKRLLSLCGVRVPPSILVDNKSYVNLAYHKQRYNDFFHDHGSVVIKAQVIGTGRGRLGLIKESDQYNESLMLIDNLYNTPFNGNLITTLLIEKRIDRVEEYFLSLFYNTILSEVSILLSKKGGIDIMPKDCHELLVDPIKGLYEYDARNLAKKAGFEGRDLIQISSLINKAYSCFLRYDCLQLEINPIIKTHHGVLYAGDCKIIVDDASLSLHREFSDMVSEDPSYLSELEREARKIDANDYRGVSGKSFLELDGDIGILASGGGASLVAMDALVHVGGRPANYVEYSGNPSREKVKKIAKIVLRKNNLSGLFIVGGTANFTDIYETLSGICEAISEMEKLPKYPILIRRAGPRDSEARKMIESFAKQKSINMIMFGEELPISEAARMMVSLSEEYKNEHTH